MKFFVTLLALLAIASAPLSAQRSGTRDTVVAPRIQRADSVSIRTAELEKSLAQLALSLQIVAQRIASDPELRVAALKAASVLVATVQHAMTDNTAAIQDALTAAAARIAAIQVAPAVPPATPSKPPPVTR